MDDEDPTFTYLTKTDGSGNVTFTPVLNAPIVGVYGSSASWTVHPPRFKYGDMVRGRRGVFALAVGRMLVVNVSGSVVDTYDLFDGQIRHFMEHDLVLSE